LGARIDGIDEVAGSSPAGSTKLRGFRFPKVQRMSYHLYVLQSEASGRFYVGQTKDLEARIAYHNANYTKSLKNRGPWRLVYSERFETRGEAMRRERQIKSWKDRRLIEQLISASR
jgi:putative endonuclease